MGKQELSIEEPHQALMWLKAFKARARLEKKHRRNTRIRTSTQLLQLVDRQLYLHSSRISGD